MNDLIYSISDTLDQPGTPVCGVDYGERISQIILSKIEVTAAGNVPTPQEFAAATDESVITTIDKIVAGHKVFLSNTEIEWHNTEWYDPIYRVEGRIMRFNESIARLCEKLTRYKELYLYYVTDKNYCFGPHLSWPDFSLKLYNGKGVPVGIEFKLDFIGNGIDYSNYNSDYEDIPIEPDTVDFGGGTVDFGTGEIQF